MNYKVSHLQNMRNPTTSIFFDKNHKKNEGKIFIFKKCQYDFLKLAKNDTNRQNCHSVCCWGEMEKKVFIFFGTY